MSALIEIAARLHHFLRKHNIDPDAVRVVLRVSDDKTRFELEGAIRRDMQAMPLYPAGTDFDVKLMKLHGVTISIGSLDYSKVPVE